MTSETKNGASPRTLFRQAVDATAPGGVYLCQVGDAVSCGACCGLYNIRKPSRERLTQILKERSGKFVGVPRTPDAIDAFGEEMLAQVSEARPFPEFHHCPFLGLVGERMNRVGCLLHPLGKGNGGVDLRGVSFYGGMACRVYFCPAYRELPDIYKRIIRNAADDWSLYGMMITEHRLISAFFRHGEMRSRRRFRQSDFEPHEARSVIRDFLRLKADWRWGKATGLCHYLFEDGVYERSAVSYEAKGGFPSPYDAMFRELESVFPDAEALKAAEAVLDSLFDRLTAALNG